MRRCGLGILLLGVLSAPAAATARPNFVVILTDDLNAGLLRYLPRMDRLLAAQSLQFGLVVPTPVCGPSRASLLTGKYAHNHGVIVNGIEHFRRSDAEKETFATWLGAVGYTTGYFGKYLNGYGGPANSYVPPGWDRWLSGVAMPGRFKFATIDETGTRASVRGEYDVDHFARATADFVATASEPFVAVWAPMSPHGPFVSAPRHRGAFRSIEMKLPATFDGDRAEEAKWMRRRLEMMLAVEEGTRSILGALRKRGILDDTWIFFTSDNGVFLGEHGLSGKGQPYEEAMRVPLYIRGPGIEPGRSDALVAVQDVGPTLLDLAGVSVPADVDGRSFAPILRGESGGKRERVLLEFWVLGGNSWRGLRTRRTKYARWEDGRCEIFRLDRDPGELQALDCSSAAGFAEQIDRLGACRGRECAQLEDAPSPSARARDFLVRTPASCAPPATPGLLLEPLATTQLDPFR